MLVLDKEFYDYVKYLLQKERIEDLKAYLTAPEQLLIIGQRVKNDKNSSFSSNEDMYSVYNCIRPFFRKYPDLLEHLLEKKFHEASVIKKSEASYLSGGTLFGNSLDDRTFDDADFIVLLALFQKHGIEIEDLFMRVYYCDQLTTKSLELLLSNGADLHSKKNQYLIVNPSMEKEANNSYDKAAFLIKAGANINAIEVNEYFEEHVLDIICNSVDFHIPYLFLYIKNGARRAGFIHRLIALKSKKGIKFKYVLVKLYLDKNPELVNEYSTAGLTPLHLAIAHEDSRMVAVLLQYGADKTLVTQNAKSITVKKRKIKKGNTALDLGNLIGNTDIITSLKNKATTLNIIADGVDIPSLDPVFHQILLDYIKRVTGFVEEQEFTHLYAKFDKELLHAEVPVIFPIVYELAVATWGDLKAHHYQLLHVILVLGEQRCSWSIGNLGGVIEFASWIELLNKNVFCRNEDYGTTFVSLNKKNIRFNFSATYESHKVFHLKLTLEQYLAKLFDCLGMAYWMYCFISPTYNLMEKLPSFEKDLLELTGKSLAEFKKN